MENASSATTPVKPVKMPQSLDVYLAATMPLSTALDSVSAEMDLFSTPTESASSVTLIAKHAQANLSTDVLLVILKLHFRTESALALQECSSTQTDNARIVSVSVQLVMEKPLIIA